MGSVRNVVGGLVALAVAVGAAACAPAGTANSAETMRLWTERDRRTCEESGGRWHRTAEVCMRGGGP